MHFTHTASLSKYNGIEKVEYTYECTWSNRAKYYRKIRRLAPDECPPSPNHAQSPSSSLSGNNETIWFL